MHTLARIALDCSVLALERRTGVENYSAHLMRALAEGKWEHQLHFYFRRIPPDWMQVNSQHRVKARCYAGKGWQRVVLPLWCLLDRIQVMHFPTPFLPPFVPCKTVLTVYDLQWEVNPDFLDEQSLRFHREVVAPSIKRADHLIAVSESTKRDLMLFYGTLPQRISVVLPGVDAMFRPVPDATEELRRLYGLDGDFFLFVGTVKPNKNLPRLLEAFAHLRRRGAKHRLVIVGEWGWRYEPVVERLTQPDIQGAVVQLGFVPNEHLPLFYSATTALLSPSLYEGFGLPVLEAMACGAPVITSNVSSLPEVVGDAAILVDPLSVDELAGAMERLLDDDELRLQMIQKGFERARQFSWEKAAQETLAVYTQVLRD